MAHAALRTLVAAAAAAAVLTLSGCTMAVLAAYDIATDARALSVQQPTPPSPTRSAAS